MSSTAQITMSLAELEEMRKDNRVLKLALALNTFNSAIEEDWILDMAYTIVSAAGHGESKMDPII